MILYLDTNALIYSLTGKPEFKDPARHWLDSFAALQGALLVTSRLTILEALIGPLKQADVERTGRIEAAFNTLFAPLMLFISQRPWSQRRMCF